MPNAAIPRVDLDSNGPIQVLTNSTQTTAFKASAIVFCEPYRYATVLVDVNASATGNVTSMLPLVTANKAPVVAGDDVWFGAAVYDGSVTAQLPGGTVVSGADFTLTPEFGKIVLRPTIVYLETTDGGSDEQRLAFVVDVGGARYFRIDTHATTGAPVVNLYVQLWC